MTPSHQCFHVVGVWHGSQAGGADIREAVEGVQRGIRLVADDHDSRATGAPHFWCLRRLRDVSPNAETCQQRVQGRLLTDDQQRAGIVRR